MRRSIQFCGWKAKWWKEQIDRRPSISEQLREGLTAYAVQHASTEQRRIIAWSTKWAAIRERAAVVLGAHLVGREDQVTVSELDIELEDEDEDAIPILDDEE